MELEANSVGRAETCANIALAKYWGKSERGDNLTAVPSLSLTLDAMRTRTEVRFQDGLEQDQVTMGGQDVQGRPLGRITELLDRMRAQSGERRRARVTSFNNFPTAAGLASSASGFAALSVAAAQAARLELPKEQLSAHARKSSASAARSLFGGFAILEAEADAGQPLFAEDHWAVAMVVAVIGAGPKPIGSTGGMIHTKETSPFYPAWERAARASYEQVAQGVRARDFEQVALGMEHSTRMMHATMFTSRPPVLYLKGTTVELMHEVAARRTQGEPMAYTMDAGPNVKVFTLDSHIAAVCEMLSGFPGVQAVIVARPGPGASLLETKGPLEQARRLDGKVWDEARASFRLRAGS